MACDGGNHVLPKVRHTPSSMSPRPCPLQADGKWWSQPLIPLTKVIYRFLMTSGTCSAQILHDLITIKTKKKIRLYMKLNIGGMDWRARSVKKRPRFNSFGCERVWSRGHAWGMVIGMHFWWRKGGGRTWDGWDATIEGGDWDWFTSRKTRVDSRLPLL